MFVKGPGSIHVVGSFEAPGPYDGLSDEDDLLEDQEDDDEESEEVAPKKGALPAKPQQPLKHAAAKTPAAAVEKKSPVNQAQNAPAKIKSPVQSPKQGVKAPVQNKRV